MTTEEIEIPKVVFTLKLVIRRAWAFFFSFFGEGFKIILKWNIQLI